MASRKAQLAIGLAVILLTAVVFRAWNLDWGLPQEFHPDEPLVVPRAVGAVVDGEWNPHYFLVPSLQTGVTSVAYGILYTGGRISGKFKSSGDFGQWAANNNTVLFLIGRGLSVFFGLVVVFASMLFAGEILRSSEKLRDGPLLLYGPVIAGIIAAVSPLMITSSRFITPDMPMLAFFVLTLWTVVRAVRVGSARLLLLAGLFAGLAVSSKYSAAILVIPIVTGLFMIQGKGKGNAVGSLFGVIGMMALGFLAGTPYALLDFSTFIQHLQIQYIQQHEGHLGMERAGLTSLHMLHGLIVNEGYVFLAAGIAGLVIVWMKFRSQFWLLVPIMVLYLIEISRWTVYADRYLLPALPITAVLIGVGSATILNGLKNRIVGIVVLIVITALVAVPQVITSVESGAALGLPDTRTIALEWVEEGIEPGSRILLELGGPQPADANKEFHREPSYDVMVLPPAFSETSQGMDPISILMLTSPEYVITSSNYRDRYENNYARERFPDLTASWTAYYEYLDTRMEVVLELSAEDDGDGGKVVGPGIIIYQSLNDYQ